MRSSLCILVHFIDSSIISVTPADNKGKSKVINAILLRYTESF